MSEVPEAQGYKLDSAAVGANENDGGGLIRMTMFRRGSQIDPICTLTMSTEEAYTFAQAMLKVYDHLEGIDHD